MNIQKILYFFVTLVLGCSACTNRNPKANLNVSNKHDSIILDYNDSILVPIAYDFKTLRLSLNDKKIDTFWRWSHMMSHNPMPDTTTFEHYMNISQPLFTFDGSQSLPALYIKTYKNKIIHITAPTVLDLPDNSHATLNRVFDSLVNYELLKDKSIRNQLINKGYFFRSNNEIEEFMKLELDNHSGYSHGSIHYGIQLKSKYNRSFKYYLKD